MTHTLKGISASKGFAIAPVHVYRRGLPDAERRSITARQVAGEVKRFERAVAQAAAHLDGVRELVPEDAPDDIATFIDTHLLMLNDTALTSGVVDLVRSHRCNVEWAVHEQRTALLNVFDAMDDDYLRTRRDDIDHVISLILTALAEAPMSSRASDPGKDRDLRVVFADDLTPADTIALRGQQVAAFVTELGGPNSHTAIVARSLGIPAIVGLAGAGQWLQEGVQVIVDGRQGEIIIDPDDALLDDYRRRQGAVEKIRRQRRRLRSAPACTLDGEAVTLEANIDLPGDIAQVRHEGASSVGLYRTEYLFMNRDSLPDEREQFIAYRNVLRRMRDGAVTLRTLDLGADKTAAAVSRAARDGIGPTTALGLRAVRFCLREPEVFRTQVRAMLRASAFGELRMLVPMISSLPEFEHVRAFVAKCRAELVAEGATVADSVPIGVMVEVPAVAVCADQFARAADFLSIGTNDLIQYTLAVDRDDETVNYLYDPAHPAVLRLIRGVLDAGRRADTPVAMCGEMAGDSAFTRLLLGLGLRSFSVQPSAMLEVKQIVNGSDVEACTRHARRLLNARTPKAAANAWSALNEGVTEDV